MTYGLVVIGASKGGLRALPQRRDAEQARDSRRGPGDPEQVPLDRPLLPLPERAAEARGEGGVPEGNGCAHPRAGGTLALLRPAKDRARDRSPSWDPKKFKLANGSTVGFDYEQGKEKIAHEIPEDVKGHYLELLEKKKAEGQK